MDIAGFIIALISLIWCIINSFTKKEKVYFYSKIMRGKYEKPDFLPDTRLKNACYNRMKDSHSSLIDQKKFWNNLTFYFYEFGTDKINQNVMSKIKLLKKNKEKIYIDNKTIAYVNRLLRYYGFIALYQDILEPMNISLNDIEKIEFYFKIYDRPLNFFSKKISINLPVELKNNNYEELS